jgi:hypothetical protein
MANINHAGDKAPCTRDVTLDGTVQQIIHPPYTRYISIFFSTVAGTYKLQCKDATVDSDLLGVPADTWFGVPIAPDYSTGNPAGTASPLFVQGTLGEHLFIEYSFVGGRGG